MGDAIKPKSAKFLPQELMVSLFPPVDTWVGNEAQMRFVKCLVAASCLVTLFTFGRVIALCDLQDLQGDIPAS